MFSSAVQPAIVSLFSSSSTDPLSLFSTVTDKTLPSDSFISLLHDASSIPSPLPPATLISAPSLEQMGDLGEEEHSKEGYTLDQTVLHIQSPTLRTTYIRCPPVYPDSGRGRRGDLGMRHPWVHMQVRNVGREWSFELGLVDKSGREGIVRCSTFQRQPRLKMVDPPLLHLPLTFPSSSSHPLTTWCTVSLNLPSLLPHFSSASLTAVPSNEDGASDTEVQEDIRSQRTLPTVVPVPSGIYSHVSYIKVYATCRLRRIWFSDAGPNQKLPWEFQLYAAN